MSHRSIWREPLLHFFILGAALFGLYAWLNPAGEGRNEILVDQERQARLVSQFRQVWQRDPTEDELQGLIDSWVREEILYREGLAQGFDLNDQVVRRRVAQKMSFIADGLVPEAPSDVQLQQWLDQHAERYRVPARYWLRQVYFDPLRHGEQLEQVMAEARRALEMEDALDAGDATLLPARLENTSATEVQRQFGEEFTVALEDLPLGDWQGPVRSGFGWHLVRIEQREASRPATLEEARAAVERDLLQARSDEINERFLESLKQNYTVRIVEFAPQPEAGNGG